MFSDQLQGGEHFLAAAPNLWWNQHGVEEELLHGCGLWSRPLRSLEGLRRSVVGGRAVIVLLRAASSSLSCEISEVIPALVPTAAMEAGCVADASMILLARVASFWRSGSSAETSTIRTLGGRRWMKSSRKDGGLSFLPSSWSILCNNCDGLLSPNSSVWRSCRRSAHYRKQETS